jgi:hypothetical protein
MLLQSRIGQPRPEAGGHDNMNTTGILLIRTDATTQIGAGHIMRCLTLAEAWQSRKGEVVMAKQRLSKAA